MKKIFFLILFFAYTLQFVYPQTKPYVLLISFDGFRWDYPSTYNTPNINFLKDSGASAVSLQPCFPSKTFPNHYSIITGMYAENHGIIANAFVNPVTGEQYRLGDTISVRDPKWYTGEAFWETAKKNGIITASMFWPGSEVNDENRRPDYFKYYDHNYPYKDRIGQIMKWLELPYPQRPYFICSYFDATDHAGHTFGPSSPETEKAVMSLDSILGTILNRLNQSELKDSINILLVSDHGMTEVSKTRIVNIEQILKDEKCRYSDAGPVMMIFPKEGETERIYRILKQYEKNFKVYLKKDIPGWYHYSDNSLIAPVLVIADIGWSVVSNNSADWFSGDSYRGNHGFSNYEMDMHGIFFAYGPLIKKGLRTGTLRNIDIYPLLCKIYNIEPNHKTDGQFEKIGFILKE
jgi:predicted AlkP superfamily pyrophosphatase or phosphodiesterase